MNSKILRLIILSVVLATIAIFLARDLASRIGITSTAKMPASPAIETSPPAAIASVAPASATAPAMPPISRPDDAVPIEPTPAIAAVKTTPRATTERKLNYTLDAATARFGKDGRSQSSADGLFDRVFIPAKGEIPVHVSIPEFLAGEEVTITAPNGGKLKRKNGELRFTPQEDSAATLDLTFEPTMGRGVYTITIRQAGALATLDFWAGEITPIGQPGPAYVALPATETSVENIP